MNDLITTINTLALMLADKNNVIANQAAHIERLTKRIKEIETSSPVEGAAE